MHLAERKATKDPDKDYDIGNDIEKMSSWSGSVSGESEK
jgi:hypothetical protein